MPTPTLDDKLQRLSFAVIPRENIRAGYTALSGTTGFD
jgi:hypothetical protein